MPIIKSTSRKDTNFKQLVSYVFKHDGKQEQSFTLFQNMNGVEEFDHKQIIERFKANDTFRKQRSNGIGMYHDIISFSKGDSQFIKDNLHVLEDIGREYMQLRFPFAMGMVKPHFDKDHIHLHVVYSPNNYSSDTSVRISKNEFNQIKRSLEEYQLKHYPELTTSYVHSRDRFKDLEVKSEKNSQKRFMYEQPDTLQSKVKKCVSSSKSLSEIEDKLRSQNLQPYYRKEVLQGILHNNKKYRLSTLVKDNESLKSIVKKLQLRERERLRSRFLRK